MWTYISPCSMLEISFFAQVGTAINISSYHPTRKKKTQNKKGQIIKYFGTYMWN